LTDSSCDTQFRTFSAKSVEEVGTSASFPVCCVQRKTSVRDDIVKNRGQGDCDGACGSSCGSDDADGDLLREDAVGKAVHAVGETLEAGTANVSQREVVREPSLF
jgi:hypothetical protein